MIWPLKISNAFWMSGSFLNVSLLNATGAVFFSAVDELAIVCFGADRWPAQFVERL